MRVGLQQHVQCASVPIPMNLIGDMDPSSAMLKHAGNIRRCLLLSLRQPLKGPMSPAQL